MRLAIILSAAFGIAIAVAGYVALSIAGKDTASFVAFVSAAAVFLVPHIMSLVRTRQTQSDIRQTQSDISEIKERTNGPLTLMQRQVDSIARQVSDLSQDLKDHLKGGNNAGSA